MTRVDSPVPLMHYDPDRSWITDPDSDYPKGTHPKANKKRRDGELSSAWSMDRTIYVKTSPDGRPIKIIELEDLENL